MPDRIKSCFNGCSFTWGEGFDSDERDLYVYDRLVTKKLKWDHSNIAQKGSSNYQIFMRSADAIQSGAYDIVFTQWSGLNRIWLSPGPDTVYFTHDEKYPDYRYRDIYIDEPTKKKLNGLLLILNHDYSNILDLIGYCGILESLGKNTNTKIIFINGLVPWQSDLITPIGSDLGNSLSEYTKSILDFDNRSDDEILKHFSVLQGKMSLLNKHSWINMFDSFQSNLVDVATEGHHPGKVSHAWMADKIVDYLKIDGII